MTGRNSSRMARRPFPPLDSEGIRIGRRPGQAKALDAFRRDEDLTRGAPRSLSEIRLVNLTFSRLSVSSSRMLGL
jgi:hypothetical protein